MPLGTQQRTVNVYLTREVIQQLYDLGSDQIIEMVDDQGGVFTHLADNLQHGGEGSGVWIDAAGEVHYGVGGGFVQRPQITEMLLSLRGSQG